MVPPPLLSSNTRRLSSAFISGAISSSASPLQASFLLTCRSPLASPRRETTRHDNNDVLRLPPDDDASRGSSSAYLAPPAVGYTPRSLGRTAFGYGIENGNGNLSGQEIEREDEETTTLDGSPVEWDTFLRPRSPGVAVAVAEADDHDDGKLGVLSTINIIVGKTVGVGAYTVPSAIFAGVGSVGMTLVLWIVGSIISFCGLAVYLDLGTAMPKSGGERVYLERIFRRPRMLATCMFMAYVVLLGFSTPNAIVLGHYALYALDADPEAHPWLVRAAAVASVTVLCWVHARHPRLGLRVINVLGFAKIMVVVAVVVAGIAGGLLGVGGRTELWALRARRLDAPLHDRTTAQRNFSDVWAGSSTRPYDYATALLKVIYCFRGYSTANQVASDVRDPRRTLRVAAPAALTLVSLAYLAVSVAFFLVVEKSEFRSAGVVVAGIFFRNVFGPGAGSHILPLFIIVSALGNIAATSFAQARVNEELARDGLLPYAKFWTTTTPREKVVEEVNGLASSPISAATKRRCAVHSSSGTPPAKGLLLHWAVSVAAIVLPPGHIYAFLVDLGGYPVGVISAAISFGLLYLHLSKAERWVSPCPANVVAISVFAAANALLLVLPWIPPVGERGDGGDGEAGVQFPYYAYPATSMALLGSGALYWCYWRFAGNGSTARREGRRRAWSGPDGEVLDAESEEQATRLMLDSDVVSEGGNEHTSVKMGVMA